MKLYRSVTNSFIVKCPSAAHSSPFITSDITHSVIGVIIKTSTFNAVNYLLGN
jgi:hypothetical protein